MNKKTDQVTEEKYNQMKQTEADLVRNLQAVVKDPAKEASLSDAIYSDHKTWLKIIMPNYSHQIHLGIVKGYENDERYQSYYDDKAGKGATKVLIKIIKDHLQK